MISYDRVVFFTTRKNFFCNTWSSANFVITDVIFYAFPSSFLHSVEKMSQFLIFLSISSYLLYFLIQLVFSEPNLHAQILIFTQAYSWKHGASVTCVNDENLKFWLHHRKEKTLISLVTSFYHDRMKITISPRMFYNTWVFSLLKKLILQYMEVLQTLLSRT